MFGVDERGMEELGGIEIVFGEAVRGDLVVVISGVVEGAGIEVVAVGKDGDFVFIVAKVGATALLVDGMENVEELVDARDFVVGGEGIEFGEGDFREAGLGREVARKADGAHAAAVFGESEVGGEVVFRGFGGEVLVIAELEIHFVERGIVGKDAGRVVVDFEAVGDGFDGDSGAGGIRDDPVEFGSGELVAKVEVAEVHLLEESFCFGDSGALAEDPGKELELSYIILAVDMVVIDGVADEVKTGDAEAFFVGGVVEEGVAVGDVGDADNGVVRVEAAGFAEIKGEVAGDNNDFFAVGKFVVEVTAEVGVFGFVSGGSAHEWSSFLVLWFLFFEIAMFIIA